MKVFTVLDLLDLDLKEQNSLNLRCVAGRKGLINKITVPELNRPGLALSGFFENFANDRIQIFGQGENAYLKKLRVEEKTENVSRLFDYDIPCMIFTHNSQPSDEFITIAEEHKCPILQSNLTSSDFSNRLIRALNNVFAPQKTVHGVLMEVSGIGVLITGESGVGKSEAALELIERGHRLVGDDAIEIKCVNSTYLMGSVANKIIGHHMEIRGLGIINVAHIFGVRAIRDKKQIQVVVHLEDWSADKKYDRLGSKETYTDLLGVKIPYVNVPVKPGRNIPIIIETAAMNERLKKLGYYSAKEFNQSINNWIESENARSVFLGKNNI